MADFALAHITPEVFRAFRDERMKVVKAATLRRQLCILQHAFNVATKEWELPLFENPVAAISKPALDMPRERRLKDGEFDRLIKGCSKSRVWWLSPVMRLALETGMWRGELLNIHRHHINFERRTLLVPVTKNGHARTIPLTEVAIAILKSVSLEGDRLFPSSSNAFRLAW